MGTFVVSDNRALTINNTQNPLKKKKKKKKKKNSKNN